MKYGKLTVRMAVVDLSTPLDLNGQSEPSPIRSSRRVLLLTRHCLTYHQAKKLAREFVKTNILDPNQRNRIDVVWEPDLEIIDIDD